MIESLGATLLARSFWLGPALCLATRFSDRLMTVHNARLYKAQTQIAVDGSFEINPRSQADIDALRIFSVRFVPMLFAPAVCAVIFRLAEQWDADFSAVYLGVLGMFLLKQLAIHIGHARTWYLFKVSLPFMCGSLETPRGVELRASAFKFLNFAVLFLAIYGVTDSFFVLGGACGCTVMAVSHHGLARGYPLQHASA